jgi:hypothetical protein
MQHDYHFKLNEESLMKLTEISMDLGFSLSKTIVVLFENFLPFVEKNHLMTKGKDSKYRIIANSKEKRYSVHCYMTENLYRKMKQLHHDLNVYSLAQIIRKMIDLFIFGCNKYGIIKFIDSLVKIKFVWRNKKECYKKENTIFMRQLSKKIIHFSYILINYDINSQPCIIQYT